MRVSIIDLGTNTFNLLVCELYGSDDITVLHRSKYPTKIGEGGINNNNISDRAKARAYYALTRIKQIIAEFKSTQTIAFATSAIRSADNGQEFVNEIAHKFGIDVQIISGDREAELIYFGARKSVELDNKPIAILDIGGGSNEVIIANSKQIFWKKSYPLGMTRLLEKFKPSEPITTRELTDIEDYLETQLEDLLAVFKQYSIKTLIGSSGSFSTLRQVILARQLYSTLNNDVHYNINLNDFSKLHQEFINSTLEQRKLMPGMDNMRVHLMVIASVFINFLLTRSDIEIMYQSAFALKEGALFEFINNEYSKPI